MVFPFEIQSNFDGEACYFMNWQDCVDGSPQTILVFQDTSDEAVAEMVADTSWIPVLTVDGESVSTYTTLKKIETFPVTAPTAPPVAEESTTEYPVWFIAFIVTLVIIACGVGLRV